MLGAEIALAANFGAHAQQPEGSVDISKITGEHLLAGTADSLVAAIWLSGYYNGVRSNKNLVFSQLQRNSELVAKECAAHPDQTVMQTVEAMMSKQK